jgi:hypothetical protein
MPANDGAAMQWSANGAQAAVLLRPGANQDRWIATVDLAAAKLKPVHRLIDVAWVNNGNNDFGWLPPPRSGRWVFLPCRIDQFP